MKRTKNRIRLGFIPLIVILLTPGCLSSTVSNLQHRRSEEFKPKVTYSSPIRTEVALEGNKGIQSLPQALIFNLFILVVDHKNFNLLEFFYIKWSKFEISRGYTIMLQRYRTEKIKICGKDSIYLSERGKLTRFLTKFSNINLTLFIFNISPLTLFCMIENKTEASLFYHLKTNYFQILFFIKVTCGLIQ